MNKLIPIPLKGKKETKHPLCKLMKDRIIPSFPESTLLIGKSGSGKTTAMLYLIKELLKTDKGKPFFDPEDTYLYSFSGKSDPSFELLGLPEENIYSEDLIENLEDLVSQQREEVEEEGQKSARRILIILEDVTGSRKFMNSKSFIKCFIGSRHILASVIACGHKYSALPRTARLNSNNIIIFPSQKSEIMRLYEDHCPPQLNKKQFFQMVEYAWTPTKEFPRPFLYINLKVDFTERYRKGFHEILELN